MAPREVSRSPGSLGGSGEHGTVCRRGERHGAGEDDDDEPEGKEGEAEGAREVDLQSWEMVSGLLAHPAQ